jgi:hypothetical protein
MNMNSYYCTGWTDKLGSTNNPERPDATGYVDADNEEDAEAKFRADNKIPDDCDVTVNAG